MGQQMINLTILIIEIILLVVATILVVCVDGIEDIFLTSDLNTNLKEFIRDILHYYLIANLCLLVVFIALVLLHLLVIIWK